MLVHREFTFEAAHHLPAHPGPCRRPHGHGYRFRLTVEAPVDPATGLAIDFADLKEAVESEVLSVLDHRDLNEVLPIPSAEHIAVWIWDRLARAGLPLFEIVLMETPTSGVTYRGEGLGPVG